MEQTHYKAIAAIGGAIGAAGENIVQMVHTHLLSAESPYAINWADTFQICWKSGVGAIIGLAVKHFWDKIFKNKNK